MGCWLVWGVGVAWADVSRPVLEEPPPASQPDPIVTTEEEPEDLYAEDDWQPVDLPDLDPLDPSTVDWTVGTAPPASRGVPHGVDNRGTPPAIRYRADIPYPPAAVAPGVADARCEARVRIDDTGTPVEVSVRSCPPLFTSATERGLMAYRWEAPTPENAVEFELVVRFTPPSEP